MCLPASRLRVPETLLLSTAYFKSIQLLTQMLTKAPLGNKSLIVPSKSSYAPLTKKEGRREKKTPKKPTSDTKLSTKSETSVLSFLKKPLWNKLYFFLFFPTILQTVQTYIFTPRRLQHMFGVFFPLPFLIPGTLNKNRSGVV